MANKVARKKKKLRKIFRGERAIYFTLALILLAIPVCNVYTKAILSETNIELEEAKRLNIPICIISHSLDRSLEGSISFDEEKDLYVREFGMYNEGERRKRR